MNNKFKEVIPLLQDLVKIESPYFKEEDIMEFASNWLSQNDIDNNIHEYHESKITDFHGKNVVSIIDSKKPGPVVLFNGHLDTVLLCNGWTKDPYAAEIEGDRLYGLGALDMKSGCAAMMVALKHFLADHKDFKGKIITSLVSDEEGPYGLGTNAIIEDGLVDQVDISIVTEPSAGFTGGQSPCICLGARGGYGLSIEFYGKSAHAANPELGINAACEGGKLLAELPVVGNNEDKYLGKGSICVVNFHSDAGACSVPDRATAQLFWHIIPGEDKNTIIDEINGAAQRSNLKCDYKIVFRDAPSEGSEAFLPYRVEEDNEYVTLLKDSISQATGKSPTTTYFQSIGDFNYLGTRLGGAPCILFGADGANYHSADEYVEVSSVLDVTASLYEFLVRLLK